MPTLKQLTCSVEWELSKIPLQEFQTTYSDGYVETYIAVPELPTPFSIHLQSNGYIAPGLSMFVYIDGVYQCNRNRQNLRIPDKNTTKKQTEVNFRVRQKEELSWNGSIYGKPWKFERVNIVSNLDVGTNERAPYDGEYVGTIEVVVLRCLPSTQPIPNFTPAKTPPNGAISSSSDSSDNDGLPSTLDGAADPKPKPTPNSRSESTIQGFGLDGYWDDPKPATSPTETGKKSPEKASDGWGEWPAVTEDPSNESWGNWDEPAPTKDERKIGVVEMTGANAVVYHPPTGNPSDKAAPKAGSVSGSKAVSKAGPRAGYRTGSQSSKPWISRNESSSTKDQVKKRSGDSTHANSRILNSTGKSSSTKPASKAGSQSGSQQDQSSTVPSATGQQTPRAIELRGGGASSYSAHSRRGSAIGSPVFNIGFYNGPGSGVGTPPPLSMGPPPPRDWQAEEAARKTAPRPKQQPTAQPVIDGWGDLPNIDANDTTAGIEPDPKDKIDNWNAGGSDVPGAWDTSNDQENNEGWGASSTKPQDSSHSWDSVPDETQNSDYTNQATKASSWDAPNSDVQDSSTWPDAGKASDWDEPAKLDAEETNFNGEDYNNGGNLGEDEDNVPQASYDWNNNNTSNAQQADTWNNGNDDDGGGATNHSWGNVNAENMNTADDKPAPANGPKKGSQPGWVRKATSAMPKGQSPLVGGLGSAAGNRQFGSWSPPPQPKKWTPPQAGQSYNTTTHAKPSLSSYTVPKAKAYWSTWQDPNALEEGMGLKEPIVNAEEPLYAIPEEVAARNNMSHQVRPGPPTTYAHKVSKPKYMDTHETPYAVFVFQYRDKTIIEEMLQTTIDDPEIDEKRRLSGLPKSEIIEELLKEKAARSASGSSISERAATFKSNPRGVPIEPSASALRARLSKLEGSKTATPDMVGAWVDSAQGQESGNAGGNGAANGKGNWGNKDQNKADKNNNNNKSGGNWAGNGGTSWSNKPPRNITNTANTWTNNPTTTTTTKPTHESTAPQKTNHTHNNNTWNNSNSNPTQPTNANPPSWPTTQNANPSSWDANDNTLPTTTAAAVDNDANANTNTNLNSWGETTAAVDNSGGGW